MLSLIPVFLPEFKIDKREKRQAKSVTHPELQLFGFFFFSSAVAKVCDHVLSAQC